MPEQQEQHQPHSHAPLSADPRFGYGYYSDKTAGCYNVVERGTPEALAALDHIPTPSSGHPFYIADYGTADGGTSMVLMHRLVERLREKHGDDLPVVVLYEDQEWNEWTSLFLRLHHLIPTRVDSFLQRFPNVYAFACGTTFYRQCAPPRSIHLGVSFTAMHWLTRRPCALPDAIHHTQSQDNDAKQQFAQQAAADLEEVLRHRAAEMVTGGRLVLVNFTVDDQGQHLGTTYRENGPTEKMLENMNRLWWQMCEEGKITETEYRNTTLNNYYRTLNEFKAPFQTGGAADRMGLKLVSIESRVVNCPFHERWMRIRHGDGDGDDEKRTPRQQAEAYVPTTRTWSNSSFLNGLSDDRSDEEKQKIVDEFFKKYEDLVAEAPEKHGMDYVHCYMVIEKQ
eukprot:gb/GECH01012119.1/.p1 GENE.gb/GECH01012119.1/~~gb/GECH01012119.1/.p1  ORF type:complete len:396 (+),score=85.61 gb/GECH01012119.1/:1-1188(+)